MQNILLVFLIFLLGCTSKELVSEATLYPVRSDLKQQELLQSGITLHDSGELDQAIEKYNEVLKINPDNVDALYEISNSYFVKKDFENCIKYSIMGAKYKSDLLSGFYMNAANAYDNIDETGKAIQLYDKAIVLSPGLYILYYNRGIAYNKIGQKNEALNNFKEALHRNANHASSHLAIANIYLSDDYIVPSLLAFSRFLILEPSSNRSLDALNNFRAILNGNISKDEQPNSFSIMINTDQPTYDGKFAAIDLTLSILAAGRLTKLDSINNELHQLASDFESLLQTIDELKKDSKGFVWEYYIPYFIDMKNQKHIEAFIYYIHQASDIKFATIWLDTNKSKLNNFLHWSENYTWQ